MKELKWVLLGVILALSGVATVRILRKTRADARLTRAASWMGAFEACPEIREFRRLFPSANVTVFQRSVPGEPDALRECVGGEAWLYERYEFTVTVPILWGEDGKPGTGVPEFELRELESVTSTPEGWTGRAYRRSIPVSHVDWRRIVESGGRLEAVLPGLTTDQPVPGFDRRDPVVLIPKP